MKLHSAFNPEVGGHAPGDLRDAFLSALRAQIDWLDSEPDEDERSDGLAAAFSGAARATWQAQEPKTTFRGEELSLLALSRLLENCSDFLPHAARDELGDFGAELPSRASFGEAARWLVGELTTNS